MAKKAKGKKGHKKHGHGRRRVTRSKVVAKLKVKKPKGWFAWVKKGKVLAAKKHSKKKKELGKVVPFDRHAFYYVKGNKVHMFKRVA
jgi:hypothetical protein